jgi:hypothetical protein
MADVDMTDAPAAAAPKTAKASKSEGSDKKPRFEVKKVTSPSPTTQPPPPYAQANIRV